MAADEFRSIAMVGGKCFDMHTHVELDPLTLVPIDAPAPLTIHGAALYAMAEGKPEEAARLSATLAGVLRDRRRLTTRMLQSLDAYWLHCDGLPKGRYPRGKYGVEDWWTRFERYRAELEAMVRA